MHATGAGIGGFLGGLVAVFCLALLWERLLRARLGGDVARQAAALVLAWITAGVLGGFGFAEANETFAPRAFAQYLLPALVAAPVLYLRALSRRRTAPPGEIRRGG